MAEEPYDDLDIGYIEYPMPNTEEFTVIRFLNKTGVARLWQKIKDKFVKIPTGGTTGQALIKTEGGIVWGDVSNGDYIETPEGGSPGDALLKTESGVEWGEIVQDIPIASETQYGTVKFASDSDFDAYMGIESSNSISTQVASLEARMDVAEARMNIESEA